MMLFPLRKLLILASCLMFHSGWISANDPDQPPSIDPLDSRNVSEVPDLLGMEDDAIQRAVEIIAPCIARIETLGGSEFVEKRLFGGGPTTGLVVDSDGWILSSAFGFVHKPTSILVDIPGHVRLPATIVARDEARRLVLLQVHPTSPLPVPTFVARDELVLGQRTIAVGRTFSPEAPNLSVGILSALRRIFGRAVQTDAKVSPSNYGGPLIDLQGRVIGLLVPLSPDQQQDSSALAGSEWYDSGVGFAVPLARTLARLEDLQAGHSLFSGRLGVLLEPGYRFTQQPTIKRVIPHTPAADTGLEPGDVIAEVDGVSVATMIQFQTALGESYAGDVVRLLVRHGSEARSAEVTLMEKIPEFAQAYLGVLLEAPSGSAQPAAAEAAPSVRYVYAESPAQQMGLQPGDRLTRVAAEVTHTVYELHDVLEAKFPGEEVSVEYERNAQTMSATGTLAERDARVAEDVPLRTPRANSHSSPAEVIADVAAAVGAAEATARGRLPLKLSDQDLQCDVFLPTKWTATDRLGLLIILPTPGDTIADEMDRWEPYAEKYGVTLMIPRPSRGDRWLPAEALRIMRARQLLGRRQQLDPLRAAVFGREGGGSMALLLGFRFPQEFQGIGVLDALPPISVDVPENRPGQRLSFWYAQREESPLNPRIDEVLTELAKRKFPLLRLTAEAQLTPDEIEGLFRWLDQLDQL